MKLHYSKQDGISKEFDIGERSITIGRSPDADIILLDDKVSRVHCGIRLWDGEFYIKDLKSKNGTFVNGRRVEVAKLKASDIIKVGGYTFTFEQPAGTGTETALREISDEMDLGKGYSTLLKEIVNDSQEPAAPPPPAPAAVATPPVRPGIRKLPQRPPIRLNIKRQE
ncbi:MAG TPA: FHA domain-containing protein [Kiritimatiellia bacterium]|nr:FHA domain-containing protein [Kiritimatiellia bacterium]HMP33487.1 FHA domain-containing protein [Kiritimatiellia bacterium]